MFTFVRVAIVVGQTLAQGMLVLHPTAGIRATRWWETGVGRRGLGRCRCGYKMKQYGRWALQDMHGGDWSKKRRKGDSDWSEGKFLRSKSKFAS